MTRWNVKNTNNGIFTPRDPGALSPLREISNQPPISQKPAYYFSRTLQLGPLSCDPPDWLHWTLRLSHACFASCNLPGSVLLRPQCLCCSAHWSQTHSLSPTIDLRTNPQLPPGLPSSFWGAYWEMESQLPMQFIAHCWTLCPKVCKIFITAAKLFDFGRVSKFFIKLENEPLPWK